MQKVYKYFSLSLFGLDKSESVNQRECLQLDCLPVKVPSKLKLFRIYTKIGHRLPVPKQIHQVTVEQKHTRTNVI